MSVLQTIRQSAESIVDICRQDQLGRKVKSETDSKAPAVTTAEESEGLSGVELVSQVEAETGLKKTTVRRIQKMIQEIATPMNLAHTIQYVQSEAKTAKMKIEDPQLEQAVASLLANG